MKPTLLLSTVAAVLLITPAYAGGRHNGGQQSRHANAGRGGVARSASSFSGRQSAAMSRRSFSTARNFNRSRNFTATRNFNTARNYRTGRNWVANGNVRHWNGNHWNGNHHAGNGHWNNWNHWHNWHHRGGSRVVVVGGFGWPWWGGYYPYSCYPYYYGSSYPYYDNYSYGYSYGYNNAPTDSYSDGYYSDEDGGVYEPNEAAPQQPHYQDDSNRAAPPAHNAYPYDSQNNNVLPRNSYVAGGPIVREVQQALTREGFYRGAIDGELGPRTQYAIRAYKREKNLHADMTIDGPLLQQLGIRSIARR